MTVLTFTTALTDVFALALYGFAYGFAITYLRLADVGLHPKLTQQSVNDNFKMKFAHTGNNCLSCFDIGISLKGWVFLRKFCQGYTHFFLTLFGFWLYCYLNNRIGEYHILQHDRTLFFTQSITRRGIFKSYQRNNFTRVGFLNFLSLRRVHLQNLTDSFPLVFDGVIDVSTHLERTTIHANVSKFAYKRVCHYFKRQSAKRLVVVRTPCYNHVGIVYVKAGNKVNIYRRRQIIRNSVQKQLNTFVFVSRTAQNRIQLQLYYGVTDTCLDFFHRELFAHQEFFHQSVVTTCDKFFQLVMIALSINQKVLRNFALFYFNTFWIVVKISLKRHKINYTTESFFLADWHLYGHCVCL